MDSDEILLRKRLKELADKAYHNSQYLFTGFLSAAELDTYYHMERDLSYVPVTVFGGTADCERVMLRFGSEELCGYEEAFRSGALRSRRLSRSSGRSLGTGIIWGR